MGDELRVGEDRVIGLPPLLDTEIDLQRLVDTRYKGDLESHIHLKIRLHRHFA